MKSACKLPKLASEVGNGFNKNITSSELVLLINCILVSSGSSIKKPPQNGDLVQAQKSPGRRRSHRTEKRGYVYICIYFGVEIQKNSKLGRAVRGRNWCAAAAAQLQAVLKTIAKCVPGAGTKIAGEETESPN